MRYIAHSVRTPSELKQLPVWQGIHVELRDRCSRLIVQAEPFADGEDFESLLAEYQHGLLVVNVKSDGIEPQVLRVLELYGVQNYVLVGCTPKMLAHLREQDEKRCAVRISDIEPAEAALSQAGQVEWAWIDGLERPLSRTLHAELKRRFKLCVTSPETYGRSANAIADFARRWHQWPVDAICTRRPELWQAALSHLAAEDATNDVADQETLLSLLRQAA